MDGESFHISPLFLWMGKGFHISPLCLWIGNDFHECPFMFIKLPKVWGKLNINHITSVCRILLVYNGLLSWG